jgi:hypothetical protein
VSDHLAKEAARLKADDMFNRALDLMKFEALTDLANADADNKTAILRLQQKVAVVDEIRATLDRYIMAAGSQQENAGSFA